MANLADDIEEFLKMMLRESTVVEIQRATLASQFRCAPSQINYVLDTRFTPQRGYVVESRRGGGGYLRIIRLNLEDGDLLHSMVHDQIGPRLTQNDALGYIQQLWDQKLINEREATLMQAVVNREAIPIELPVRDMVRASLLKAMILAILRF